MIATIAGSNASIFFRSKEEAKLAPAAINPSALLPHAPAKIQISSKSYWERILVIALMKLIVFL